MNTVIQDIDVHWDYELDELYTLIPIENQTLRLGIQLMEETYETVYGNIYVSVYNKRKHRDYNEDNILWTGRNPIQTVFYGMRAFKELEKAALEKWNKTYKVILFCDWLDRRRRDVYYKFLSRRGYRYDRLGGKKVIMKVWKKDEYLSET